MNKPVWEGVYKDIHEVKALGNGFNSSYWVNNSKEKVEKYLAGINESDPIPPFPPRPTSLPLLAAMLRKNRDKKLIIIDFGGGLGFSYLSFVQSCSRIKNYTYYIVESTEICKLGDEIFSDHHNILFAPHVQDLSLEIVDIVYMNSVLQYIGDWKALLNYLLNLKPEFFLLDDLPAGDIPTFATVQNYYSSKLPYWFFNVDDIITCVESYGYTLEYKSKFSSLILGKMQEIPMSNFPPEYQLDYPCTLLFRRGT